MKKRLLNNKGMSYPLTAILIVVIMLITFGIFEVVRLNIQAAAIRDKYEDAIISVCTQNFAEMYQPIRESTAASYKYNGSRWIKSDSTSEKKIRSLLNNAMNSGEIMQCRIDNIDFVVTPSSVAPSDVNTAQKYAVEGFITVTIPYNFAWSELTPISMTLNVKSEWKMKF